MMRIKTKSCFSAQGVGHSSSRRIPRVVQRHRHHQRHIMHSRLLPTFPNAPDTPRRPRHSARVVHITVPWRPPLLRRRRRPILRLPSPLRPRRLENRGVPGVNHRGGEPEIRSSRATRGGVVVIRRRRGRPRSSDHLQSVAVEALREHDAGAVAHAPRAGRPRGDDRLGRVDVAADRHRQTHPRVLLRLAAQRLARRQRGRRGGLRGRQRLAHALSHRLHSLRDELAR
mmetsp:Transcript_424/g.1965  ORF Transcript_424/g.1965 Transcript_424/m.1965 type:complete len:228 (-) Transcript_424:1091-1774(-)